MTDLAFCQTSTFPRKRGQQPPVWAPVSAEHLSSRPQPEQFSLPVVASTRSRVSEANPAHIGVFTRHGVPPCGTLGFALRASCCWDCACRAARRRAIGAGGAATRATTRVLRKAILPLPRRLYARPA